MCGGPSPAPRGYKPPPTCAGHPEPTGSAMKTAGILLMGILALCTQLQPAAVAAGGTGECSGHCRAGLGRGSRVGRAGKTDHTGTEPGASAALGHPTHRRQAARLQLYLDSAGRQGGLGGSSRTQQRSGSPPAHGMHWLLAASRLHDCTPRGSDNSPCVSAGTLSCWLPGPNVSQRKGCPPLWLPLAFPTRACSGRPAICPRGTLPGQATFPF